MTTNSTAPNQLQWYDVSLLRVISPCQLSPLCYNSGVHWNGVLAFVTNRLRCATISNWILHQNGSGQKLCTLQPGKHYRWWSLFNEAMPTAIGDNISVPIISTSLWTHNLTDTNICSLGIECAVITSTYESRHHQLHIHSTMYQLSCLSDQSFNSHPSEQCCDSVMESGSHMSVTNVRCRGWLTGISISANNVFTILSKLENVRSHSHPWQEAPLVTHSCLHLILSSWLVPESVEDSRRAPPAFWQLWNDWHQRGLVRPKWHNCPSMAHIWCVNDEFNMVVKDVNATIRHGGTRQMCVEVFCVSKSLEQPPLVIGSRCSVSCGLWAFLWQRPASSEGATKITNTVIVTNVLRKGYKDNKLCYSDQRLGEGLQRQQTLL